METDGKRLLIAVGVAMGLMLVWNMLFPPEKPAPAESQEGSAQEEEPAPETPDSPKNAMPVPAEAEAEVRRGPEKIFTLEGKEIAAEFSSYGGVLSSWKLQNERYIEDKKKLDLVRGQPEETLPFAIGFADSTYAVPDGAEWAGVMDGSSAVEFTWSSKELSVRKRFELVPEDYLVRMEVEFKNLSSSKAEQALTMSLTSFQDPKADTGGGMARMPQEWKAVCLIGGDLEEVSQKELRERSRDFSGDVAFAGFSHSYFLTAVAPVKTSDESRFSCRMEPAGGRAGAMKSSLEFPSIVLAPGDPSYTWKANAYLGPKFLDKLDHLDATVGQTTRLREGVDLGFFAVIARPMLSILKWFYSFVGNWGLAIVMLTFVVKLLLLPWTHKSMKSMKKMSVLAPRMKEIQERYKDDKAAQQQRIMELYKQEGVNPLAGCLPMLLQMPIWIALYRMLMYAAELYRAPMVPGWIDDLTSPDPIYVLPVLLVIVMFGQAKFTPTTGDGMQQKMLKYGMPLMFGGMSFVFPAGLTLYIFTNTLLTGVHHIALRRGDSTVSAASKSSRGGTTAAAATEVATETPATPPPSNADSAATSDSASKPQSAPKRSKKKGKKKRRR